MVGSADLCAAFVLHAGDAFSHWLTQILFFNASLAYTGLWYFDGLLKLPQYRCALGAAGFGRGADEPIPRV